MRSRRAQAALRGDARAGASARRWRSRSAGSRRRSGPGRRRWPSSAELRARRRTASSSSTTSPPIRTAARRSNGVGPWVRIAICPPAVERRLGQPGHRDRPRARTRCTASGRRRRRAPPPASIASTGRYSPNSTTPGLSGRAAIAPRHPVRGSPSCRARTSPNSYRTPQTRQTDWAIEPCTSTRFARPRPGVQPVDVLRDHRVEQPGVLELDERRVRPIGLLVLERLEALAVEAPEASPGRGGTRRCGRPPSG